MACVCVESLNVFAVAPGNNGRPAFVLADPCTLSIDYPSAFFRYKQSVLVSVAFSCNLDCVLRPRVVLHSLEYRFQFTCFIDAHYEHTIPGADGLVELFLQISDVSATHVAG